MSTPAPPIATRPEVAPRPGPGFLEWTPQAYHQLDQIARSRSSLLLDRTMLDAASALFPGGDEQTRAAIAKVDGVSLHILRFPENGADPDLIQSLRETYHTHGWRHMVTSGGASAPVRHENTDVWLATEGLHVKGAVLLRVTPDSVAYVALAGDLSALDLLHLRGHFGIPAFKGETLRPETEQ